MRVTVVDPPAYTPAYDDALCAALAARGAEVRLVTSRFAYDARPPAAGYAIEELFYRRARGTAGSAARRAAKLASHVDDMRALRRRAEAGADVVHFQWVPVPWVDVALLPRVPRVLTVHNTSARRGRLGQARARRAVIDRMDALIAHSRFGAARLTDGLGIDPARVHVIPIGALAPGPPTALPPELDDDGRPVVLMFGLLRPYKGLRTLLSAWRGIEDAQLWIVGRAMMALPPIPAGVSLVDRYVAGGEANALLRRADVIVLPYERDERIDGSGVLADALGAERATVVSAVGGLTEIADTGAALAVAPGDAGALHDALRDLIADPAARRRLAAGAAAAARGDLSWDAAAERTLALYRSLRR
jgi:glycosyltransferase involved in cell wall biosynthesis